MREKTLVEDVETLLAERTAEILLESSLFERENVFELLADFDSALEVGGGSDISLAVRVCNGGTGLSLFSIVLINWVPTTRASSAANKIQIKRILLGAWRMSAEMSSRSEKLECYDSEVSRQDSLIG